MSGTNTPPETPRRPRAPSTLNSLEDYVFSPGTKRKRTVFNVDKEVSSAPINKESGRALVTFLKDTNYLDCLKDPADQSAMQQAVSASNKVHEIPKKITDLRTLIYFAYHRIDGVDIKSLLNAPENTYSYLWLHEKNKAATRKLQTEILAWVKDRVEEIYKRNKSKAQNPVDFAQISQHERVRHFRAYFRKNPLGVAIGMYRSISKLIDFNAIFKIPDHIVGDERVALTRWQTVIFQTFTKIAEALFSHHFLPLANPEAAIEFKDEDSVYNYWKRMPDEIAHPELKLVPVKLPVKPTTGRAAKKERSIGGSYTVDMGSDDEL